MIEWGQKSKPKEIHGPKISHPTKKTHAKFPSLKNFQKPNKFGCTLLAELQGWETQALTQIFRLFWVLKKYLPNISTQKILASKIQTKKNPLTIPVTWNPGHPILTVINLHHTCEFGNALGRTFLEGNLCVLKTKKKRFWKIFALQGLKFFWFLSPINFLIQNCYVILFSSNSWYIFMYVILLYTSLYSSLHFSFALISPAKEAVGTLLFKNF